MSTASATQIKTEVTTEDYAGFWLRFVASCIDGCILFVPQLFITFAIDFATTALLPWLPKWGQGLVSLGVDTMIYYMMMIPYFAAFESSSLQGTPGKLALGLVVTDMDGNRVSFWKALGRSTGKAFSDMTIFCFFVGYLLAGFTPRKQALHDLMSSCLVLRKRNS